VGWVLAKKMLRDLADRKILEYVHSAEIERDGKSHFKLPTIK
jgi:hypothetical protein